MENGVVKTKLGMRVLLTGAVVGAAIMPTTAITSPSASAQPGRCPAPSGISTAAVIGCSCNWGSGPTLTAGGATAYCRNVVGTQMPVGFWTYTDVDIFVPQGPGDINMYVCQSQTNRSPDECAVYLTQPSYPGNGIAHY
jgi:hypothetical protein